MARPERTQPPVSRHKREVPHNGRIQRRAQMRAPLRVVLDRGKSFEPSTFSLNGVARRTLGEFAGYYNAERAHQSLDGDVPEHRVPHGNARIVGVPHLGGLHHSYRRAV